MAHRIAITGPPGIGKSTLVQKVASSAKMNIGGIMARDKRYKDRRCGFELFDLATGMVGMLADETGDGPQLGKYRVHLDDLDRIGAQAVENALSCDLIVVDEVGPMELSSHRFISAVEKAMASPKHMLVVLHQWSNHRLAKKIRGSFQVVTVTEENRDSLAEKIVQALQER